MFTRLHTFFLLVLFPVSIPLSPAFGQDVWAGGTGNWSNAANWSSGVVPNGPTVDVRIDGGTQRFRRDLRPIHWKCGDSAT